MGGSDEMSTERIAGVTDAQGSYRRSLRRPVFTDESLRRIREATSIVDVVGKRVKLRQSGNGRGSGCCPFHDDKSPSFSVDDSRGTFHCFGCNKSGDVFQYLMEAEGITFVEAVQMLADRAKITLEYKDGTDGGARGEAREQREQLTRILMLAAQFYSRCLAQRPSAGAARAHLRERGVSPSTSVAFQLGYSPADNDSPVVDYLLQEGFGLPTLVEAGLVSNASAMSVQRRSGAGSTYPLGQSSPQEEGAGPQRVARCVDRFRGRLVIPIRDHRGVVVAFGARDIGTALAPKPPPMAAEALPLKPVNASELLQAHASAARATTAVARARAKAAAAAHLAAEAEPGSYLAAAAALASAAATEAESGLKGAKEREEAAMKAAALAEPRRRLSAKAAAAAEPVVEEKLARAPFVVAKYLNSPETMTFKKSHHVFGLDLAKEAIREADCAILVEGYFDVIALHEAGIRNVVGSMGTALTAEQLQLIARFSKAQRVVLNLDADDAGVKAVERLCEGGGGTGRPALLNLLTDAGIEIKVATLPPESGCKDPGDYLQSHSAKEYREHVLGAALPWTTWYGNRIISAAGVFSGPDANDAARRAAVNRFTGFLSRIAHVERYILANGFAKALAGGDETLALRLETELVAEAEKKERRHLALQRRVVDADLSANAAAVAEQFEFGAGTRQQLSPAQRDVMRRMAAGGSTLGEDVPKTARRSQANGGRDGAGQRRGDARGRGEASSGSQRARSGSSASDDGEWRGYGPRRTRRKKPVAWEPWTAAQMDLPELRSRLGGAERQFLSLLVHDVGERNERLYKQQLNLTFSTPERQWLFNALVNLPEELRDAPPQQLLGHVRAVAPPAQAAAVTDNGSGNARWKERPAPASLGQLDELFKELTDAAELRSAGSAGDAPRNLAALEAELAMQELLWAMRTVAADEQLRRLREELNEAMLKPLQGLPSDTDADLDAAALQAPIPLPASEAPLLPTDNSRAAAVVAADGSAPASAQAGEESVVHALEEHVRAQMMEMEELEGRRQHLVQQIARLKRQRQQAAEADQARLDGTGGDEGDDSQLRFVDESVAAEMDRAVDAIIKGGRSGGGGSSGNRPAAAAAAAGAVFRPTLAVAANGGVEAEEPASLDPGLVADFDGGASASIEGNDAVVVNGGDTTPTESGGGDNGVGDTSTEPEPSESDYCGECVGVLDREVALQRLGASRMTSRRMTELARGASGAHGAM